MAGKSPFDLNDAHAATAENSEELLFQVILERPIRMPRSLSIPASKVLKRFLDKDPDTRLGCSGLNDIQMDSFFRTLDWAKLSKKQVSTGIFSILEIIYLNHFFITDTFEFGPIKTNLKMK